MTSASTAPATAQLSEHGQSVWLDYISRNLMSSGKLKQMVEAGWVMGMTSNPTIFEKAIGGSSDYDETIKRLATNGEISPYDAFVSLAVEDIQAAADVLRPVYDASGGTDGFVSLEVPPGIENDIDKTVAEVVRLSKLADRPNVMIKIPGTKAGGKALEEATFQGVNVNQTLLFAIDAYRDCAEGYIRAMERRVEQNLPIKQIASVASFFVSRVDTAVDAQLPQDSPLRGKAAIANARLAYKLFEELFSGPRWERLAAAGAQIQRPLWASTGTKNPAYSDVMYVEELVAPHTVNTVPEATLKAMLDHGHVRDTIVPNIEDAARVAEDVKAAGVDIDAVTAKLLSDGLASFEKDFEKLLGQLDAKLAAMRVGVSEGSLDGVRTAVDARLERMATEKIVQRIYDGDHTIWKPDPTEITNRLGWIPVIDTMLGRVDDLKAFAASVAGEGYRTAVLLGMGGSSLAPEVMHATFGTASGMLDLVVLDTTVPKQIEDVEGALEPGRTLFIVSSKSGGTIETLSHFAHFWEKQPDGKHFIAITDAGTPLEKLARDHRFRRVFLNPPELGGRYSALSYFGLVPAALMGVDIRQLLDRAREMKHACSPVSAPAANPGAWLGAVMGEAALAGRDKVTLVMPQALSTFGYWAEQLLAESTGKEGRGLVPIEGEPLGPPRVYGGDRLFIALGDNPLLRTIEDAGHPVVRLPYRDPYQLGAEFFRWELATAVAGYVLGINPFDQPNVQEAKDATNRVLGGDQPQVRPLSIEDALASVKAGDYIAITAYLDRDAENIEMLTRARVALRDRYDVATTVGFGPRFLHSTGQLHKGGPNTGVFIQVVAGGGPDVPIPGKTYSFGDLNRAQALGDLASLQEHGRRVARVTLAELETAVGHLEGATR